ncbi:MAG: agmatinase [Alphaproteobacteria bacterium]|nr:agmatinase [Alphaproteobacteria bacterium]
MNKADMHPMPLDSGVVPRFLEVATFMRLPAYKSAAGLDVALVGVPFDLGTTFRTGARHGPAQIREMSRFIRRVNPFTAVKPFELCKVADCGDTPINPLDLMDSLRLITEFFEEIHRQGACPIAAGGDHTVTLPILRGIAKERPVGLIHFDAHPDTLDELLGNKYNHATPFRRGVEEGLIDPKRTIQIGIRGTRYGDDDLEFGYQSGMRVVTMDEFEDLGRKGVIAEIKRVVGAGPTFLTFDIDGLDPTCAPGTGVPEPGGPSMRDVQVIIRGLQGVNLVGGDVCEVLPAADPLGMTALNAANLMFEILCVLAEAVAKRRRR